MSNKCLYCYQPLVANERDFHTTCSKKFFGSYSPAQLQFSKHQLDERIKTMFLLSHHPIDIQPKVSLRLEKSVDSPTEKQFAIVGLEGDYLLKPSVNEFPDLPELEDLTMHLASIANVNTIPHSLIKLQSGEMAFISHRIDRPKKGKLALEDMCQLTDTLTDDKYMGSMEKVGKVIHAYSSNPGFDVISLFELTLFSFLTGNADMHLKNFSLLRTSDNEIHFSPAYNLVPTNLLFPENQDEMALSINGKKRNLNRTDFDSLADKLKISAKTLDNTYKRFEGHLSKMIEFIDISFLSSDVKKKYKNLIRKRAAKLFELQEIELEKEIVNEVKEPTEIKIESTTEASINPEDDPSARQLSLF
jgi:serine/threonine-protein kinase HipA